MPSDARPGVGSRVDRWRQIVVLVFIAAAIRTASAAPFVQTFGLEHEIDTRYYSLVTDQDVTETEDLFLAAHIARLDGAPSKSLSFACYGQTFCLTNDDGNILEIVTGVWQHDQYAAHAKAMQSGLADFHDAIDKACTEKVDERSPIWAAKGNRWGTHPVEFRSKIGCIVSLPTLLGLLGERETWTVTAKPELLAGVFLFESSEPRNDGIIASHTQVNLTWPVSLFDCSLRKLPVDCATMRLFSQFDRHTLRSEAINLLAAHLWKQSTTQPQVPGAPGLANLLAYHVGITSLFRALKEANHLQGAVKNAHDLYLKSPIHEVVRAYKLQGGEHARALQDAVRSLELACDEACLKLVGQIEAWYNREHRVTTPSSKLVADWREHFAAAMTQLVDTDRPLTDIAHPWGPQVYDGVGVVVLLEMRDNNYFFNQNLALRMSKNRLIPSGIVCASKRDPVDDTPGYEEPCELRDLRRAIRRAPKLPARAPS